MLWRVLRAISHRVFKGDVRRGPGLMNRLRYQADGSPRLWLTFRRMLAMTFDMRRKVALPMTRRDALRYAVMATRKERGGV